MLLQSIVLALLLRGQLEPAPFGRKEGVPKQLSDAAPDFAGVVDSQAPVKAASSAGASTGATVNAWTLCNRPPASATYTGTSTRYASAPSWEPHTFSLSEKSYKLALYSATVVQGLGEQERKWIGSTSRAKGSRFNMDAARYVRAAVFV